MTGCFITIEGTEGVGKSTNMAFIEAWLNEKKLTYITTREPGGTDLGERLRSMLLHGDNIGDKAELLMMFAARAQHLSEKILPALEQGHWVLCDRFTDSTFAYQGGGRQLPLKWIQDLEKWVQGTLQPDLTLLLDAPVELGMTRASKRSATDRIESESLAFFERARKQFLQRAESSERYKVINAAESLDEVQKNISVALESLLKVNR